MHATAIQGSTQGSSACPAGWYQFWASWSVSSLPPEFGPRCDPSAALLSSELALPPLSKPQDSNVGELQHTDLLQLLALPLPAMLRTATCVWWNPLLSCSCWIWLGKHQSLHRPRCYIYRTLTWVSWNVLLFCTCWAKHGGLHCHRCQMCRTATGVTTVLVSGLCHPNWLLPDHPRGLTSHWQLQCINMQCIVITGAEDVDADDMEAATGELEDGDLAPQAQVILTGCWLTMKEVSLLMGAIAQSAPISG